MAVMYPATAKTAVHFASFFLVYYIKLLAKRSNSPSRVDELDSYFNKNTE